MGITAKIHKARRKRDRWRHVERKKDVKVDELRDALAEVRAEQKLKRSRRHKLIRGIRHPGWTQAARDRRAEVMADQIDELEAEVNRLVERIDDVRDRGEHAEHLRKFYAKRLDRLRKRRREIEEDQEGRLSEHFHVREFDCNNGTRVPQAAIPALRALCNDVLEPQRARYGTVHINSGYRPTAYNASIGGASNSVHIYDRHPDAVAADHWCDRGGAGDWFANTAGRADGRGRYSTFHHADNRNRIGWPDAVWYG